MKFQTNDLVLVYKGTPTFEEGLLAKVIDRDPHDKSYAVASLEAVFKEQGDIQKLLNDHVKWVAENNMIGISFDRPKTLSQRIKAFFRRLFGR